MLLALKLVGIWYFQRYVSMHMRLDYDISRGEHLTPPRSSSRPRPAKDLKNSWRHRIESIFQPSMNGIRRYWRFWSGRMSSLSLPISRTIGTCMREWHWKYAAAVAIFHKIAFQFADANQFWDAKLAGGAKSTATLATPSRSNASSEEGQGVYNIWTHACP